MADLALVGLVGVVLDGVTAVLACVQLGMGLLSLAASSALEVSGL